MKYSLKQQFTSFPYLKTICGLTVFSLVYSIYYLGLTQQWWFEDDPLQFHFASGIRNPLSLFINPEHVKSFGTGNALVPMQILSYWLDVYSSGFSAKFAYWHSVFSLLITSLLLFVAIMRFVSRPGLAFCIVVLWSILPTTISTLYFLATRHYMEGLLFSLIAIILLDGQSPVKVWRFAAIVSTAFVAMLYKEIYATFLPTFLFLICWHRRHYSLAAAIVIMAIAYAVYRLYMVGSEMHYTMPFLNFSDYILFLSKLPYVFAAGFLGYILYTLFTLNFILIFVTRPTARIKILFFLLLWVLSLATIYPVSFAVLNNYQTPGTWYRALFLFNTILICAAGLILGEYASKKVQIAVLLVTLTGLLPGMHKTQESWLSMMGKARLEGEFYLSHPDRLLFSEEPANWYLKGLDAMYHVSESHFILKNDPTHSGYKEQLLDYPIIWRYEDGEYKDDPELYKMLRRLNNYPEP